MIFDELDKRMRVFETSSDHCVLPGIHMVARIDGRNFTRLTREVHKFEAPYDERFRDMMVTTTKHLMNTGFRIIYGYTQSDEISLLFHLDDHTFGRKTRKLNSILAGEASAAFSVELGAQASFDCRICELPSALDVVDYFRWRNEDASRNALNSHCYWLLRKQGLPQNTATNQLSGQSVAQKNELLFQAGTNFNELPAWQKRGIGLYWVEVKKAGFNPKTNEPVESKRRTLKIDFELPMRDEYSSFIANLLEVR